jgi:hypothetical protein
MFKTESEFEEHIRKLIFNEIISVSSNFLLLENKDVVDIIICDNSILQPKLFFVEVKFSTQIKGRIGFGTANGNGFQPEILSKIPQYFNQNMLWIFGKENDVNYYIFTTNQILNFISGNEIGLKQNNFQQKLFNQSENKFNDETFLLFIKNWLQITSP